MRITKLLQKLSCCTFTLILFLSIPFLSHAQSSSSGANQLTLGAGLGWAPYGGTVHQVVGSVDNDTVFSLHSFIGYRFHPFFRVNSGLELFLYKASNSASSTTNLASFSAKALRIPLTVTYIAESFLTLEVGAGLAFAMPFGAELHDSTGTNISAIDNTGASFKRTRSIVEGIVVFAAGKDLTANSTLKLFVDWAPVTLTGQRVLMSLNGSASDDVKAASSYYKGYSVLNLGLRYEMTL